MLPKKFRLKKRTAFQATYRTGHSLHKDGVTLFCGKKKTGANVNPLAEKLHTGIKGGVNVFSLKVGLHVEIKPAKYPTKIGFVVSKKTHKRAVKRNRIKRLMRESVRLYIKNSPQDFDTKYMSLIFVASTKLLDKNFKEVDNAVKKLIGKILND